MTILLVDDYADIVDVLKAGLAQAGFEVVTAADGEQAVELLVREPNRFTGVVTDMMLPGVTDGGQVAAVARSLRPNIPIVVMSGLPTCLMPFFSAPRAYHILQKPFRPSQLCQLFWGTQSGSVVPRPADPLPMPRLGHQPLEFGTARPT